MQIVTVNIPSIYIDAIAKLTDAGIFPSRSEAIRVALRDFLKSELGMAESLLVINENDGKITHEKASTPVKKPVDMRACHTGWQGEKKSLSDARIAAIKHQLGMR